MSEKEMAPPPSEAENRDRDHFTPSRRPLDTAASYADLALPVIPLCPPDHAGMNGPHLVECKSPGKAPVIPGWQRRGVPTAGEIEEWLRWRPNANLGLVLGNASRLIGVDVDGETGERLLAEWSAGDMPDTWEFRTGAGRRLLYRIPDGLTLKKASMADRQKEHEELALLGEGQQTVIPPSVHQSGADYAWTPGRDPWTFGPAILAPAWVIERMTRASMPSKDGQAPAVAHAVDPAAVLGRLAERCERFKKDWPDQQASGIDEESWFRWCSLLVAAGYPDAAWMFSRAGAKHDERSESRIRGLIERQGVDPIPPVRCSSFGCASFEIRECQQGLRTNEAGEITNSPAGFLHPDVFRRSGGGDPGRQGGHHLTDLGNSRRFVDRHGRDVRFVPAWGCWVVWDGRRWSRDDTGEVYRRAKNTVTAIYAEAAGEPGDDRRKVLGQWAMRSEAEARIRAMLSLAETEPDIPVRPAVLDADPWALNIMNGTLDLRTGELRPHRREDLITKLAPVEYDPDATCPTWERFLDRIMSGNESLIGFLQRAAGYSLTGDTSEQALLLPYGVGANGKSVFLLTLLSLAGDYGKPVEPDLLMVRFGDAHPTGIADLMGARLAVAIETDQGRRLNESLMKWLTGGDKLKARFMRQDFFEFEPTHKLWLATNHKPVVRGTDYAVWRRLKLIPFTVTIPPAEQIPLRKMLAIIRAELPGILRWAVQGCLEWQRDGLGVPDEVRAATEAYREEMDALGGFLAERCIAAVNAKAAAKDLYAAYATWCEESGERPLSQKAFGMRLTERGFERDRSGGRHFWFGIGLADQRERAPCDPCDPNSPMNDNVIPLRERYTEKRVTSGTKGTNDDLTPVQHHFLAMAERGEEP